MTPAGHEPAFTRTPIRCPFVEDRHPDMRSPMQPRLVRDRVAGAQERGVIEGPQVRWSCSACGYGELVVLS